MKTNLTIKAADWQTQIRNLRRKQFIWDTLSGFLGGSTLVGALIEGYYYFYQAEQIVYFAQPQPEGNTYAIIMGTPIESTKLLCIRVYITVASIFLALAVIARYIYERKIRIAVLKANQLWDPKKHRFFGLWVTMIIEMLYALLFLPPHVNGVYTDKQTGVNVTTDMLVTSLMTGRIYLIGRMLYQFSIFHREKAQLACANSNISSTPWFVFKSELKSSPFILVGIMLTLLFFILGFGLRQCELPYEYISNFDWDFILNGVWVIFLTVTTVGYGDMYPETSLGRTLCVVAAMMGSFFTSLLVIAITDFFSMSMKERNAVYRLKRRLALIQLRDEAQTLIHWAWKYFFFVRPLRFYSKKNSNRIHYKLCTAYAKFKENRQKLWLDSEFAISEIDLGYYGVSDALSRNYCKIEMVMWDVKIFRERLVLLEKRQLQIEKMVDVLHQTYFSIENVTRPYLNASGPNKALSISFSDIGSLISANTGTFKQQIQSIAEEIPYKFLASRLENAFRFRNQEFGLLHMAKRRQSEGGLKKKKQMRASRVMNRLKTVTQSTDFENEKKELIQSGMALTLLRSLFGNERANTLHAEMKNADSKRFAKLTTELLEQYKAANSQDGNSDSASLTPKSSKTRKSIKSIESIKSFKSLKPSKGILRRRKEELFMDTTKINVHKKKKEL